jgi:hypothetical protein
MIYAYIAIAIVVRRHRMIIKRQEMQVATNFRQETGANRHSNHTKDETMKAVGIIVVIFIICSGLFQWLTICTLGEGCNVSMESPAYFVIYTLLYSKSAINFIVYALLRKDFQRELKNIFKRCFKNP